MFLNKNIHSHFKPSDIYGYAGDEVEIITKSDTVITVRHIGKKDGFPVYPDDLSDAPPKIFTSLQTIISNTTPTKKGKDVKYKPTLF